MGGSARVRALVSYEGLTGKGAGLTSESILLQQEEHPKCIKKIEKSPLNKVMMVLIGLTS